MEIFLKFCHNLKIIIHWYCNFIQYNLTFLCYLILKEIINPHVWIAGKENQILYKNLENFEKNSSFKKIHLILKD